MASGNELSKSDSPEASLGWIFENFLREILSRHPDFTGGHASTMRTGGDVGFDLVAQKKSGAVILIEAKVSTPETPARLNATLSQMQKYRLNRSMPIRATAMVLAITGVLPQGERTTLETAGVELWDGPYLRQLAASARVQLPTRLFLANDPESAPEYISLSDRLTQIAPGGPHSAAYETWLSDALEYLFCPPLGHPDTQSSTSSGTNRRDIIMANYAETGFWSWVLNHYQAHLVVVEAKNLSGKVSKDEVLQISNYLSRYGVGLFGLIISRNGLDSAGGQWTVREQWQFHQKMIVNCDDGDMRKMLQTRGSGGDPSSLLRQKIEDFRRSL